ncbi:GntR family transcriptional regulator [uncultured Bradyrhizobium sp.]|uniref:GntR family transcriptional regulator n=1 Tax=uncultured Bradyrhizobium sp. TaxID=199684 RepID=UPI002628621E|nr:GntR family transcriptional regulator [uncultured Bradyrhizobium sp.]
MTPRTAVTRVKEVRAAARKLPERVALHEQALARLRTLIVRGDLAPGVAILETKLSEELGISRTPLREALKLLAAEGLLELRSNRSAQIAPLRPVEIDEIFEVISALEGIAAELAASRMTSAELRRLTQLQDRMETHHEDGRLDDYFKINQEIHSFIVACAKNAVLKSTHDGLLARAERARYFALSSRSRWDDSVMEHREILKALKKRDGAAAARALTQHVLHTGRTVNKELRSRRNIHQPTSPVTDTNR